MVDKNSKGIASSAELLRCMEEMAAYLPGLEDPDFTPGEFRPARKTETGLFIMPYALLGDIADAFVSAAYDRGWVLRGFDWASWAHSTKHRSYAAIPLHLPKLSHCSSCT